jgi:hypothetical protein
MRDIVRNVCDVGESGGDIWLNTFWAKLLDQTIWNKPLELIRNIT